MAFPTKRLKELEAQVNKLKGQLAEANKRVEKHVPKNKVASYHISERVILKVLEKQGFMTHEDNLEQAIGMFERHYASKMDELAEQHLVKMIEDWGWRLEKNPERKFVEALKGI